MKIGKLVRDPALLPKLPKRASVLQRAGYAARAGFLLSRAQDAIAKNPDWQDANHDEVKDANKEALKAQLSEEVKTAADKVADVSKAMANPAQTELVSIDDAVVDPERGRLGKPSRFRQIYSRIFNAKPKQLRDITITTGAWATLAEDPAMDQADLHTLVSRRLMMVERMLWYIGSPMKRRWGKTTTGKWNGKDGWTRIFEYARLPKIPLLFESCAHPEGSLYCATGPDAPMAGWLEGTERYRHDFQINPTATPSWRFDPKDRSRYAFFFVKGNDPAHAVTQLFTASDDFRERNLLNCDHVINCLHLESLVRVKSRREGSTAWFRTIVDKETEGWLRIYFPNAYDSNKGVVPVFLVGKGEPRFFELKEKVETRELCVGDHVIVYNHPAYDVAKAREDVWRLENALVVATFPKLILQGHGILPVPFYGAFKEPVKGGEPKEARNMRRTMIKHFTNRLVSLRDMVLKSDHLPEIILSPDAMLVQRKDPGPYSGYDPSDFTDDAKKRGRWWIRWKHDEIKNEPDIAKDKAWAKWVWDQQKVELVPQYGYFPLWLPKRRNSSGLIVEVEKVLVNSKMAPGWTWYYENNQDWDDLATHRASVRRPKVS